MKDRLLLLLFLEELSGGERWGAGGRKGGRGKDLQDRNDVLIQQFA